MFICLIRQPVLDFVGKTEGPLWEGRRTPEFFAFSLVKMCGEGVDAGVLRISLGQRALGSALFTAVGFEHPGTLTLNKALPSGWTRLLIACKTGRKYYTCPSDAIRRGSRACSTTTTLTSGS